MFISIITLISLIMDSIQFHTKPVKDLQQFLKDRGVIFSDQKKVDLVELFENFIKLNIEVDPDGLLEDRDEITFS